MRIRHAASKSWIARTSCRDDEVLSAAEHGKELSCFLSQDKKAAKQQDVCTARCNDNTGADFESETSNPFTKRLYQSESTLVMTLFSLDLVRERLSSKLGPSTLKGRFLPHYHSRAAAATQTGIWSHSRNMDAIHLHKILDIELYHWAWKHRTCSRSRGLNEARRPGVLGIPAATSAVLQRFACNTYIQYIQDNGPWTYTHSRKQCSMWGKSFICPWQAHKKIYISYVDLCLAPRGVATCNSHSGGLPPAAFGQSPATRPPSGHTA